MGSSRVTAGGRRTRVTIEDPEGKYPPVVFEFTGRWSSNFESPVEEIRTNPAMFAALSGAPVSVWKDLPGETVEFVRSGPRTFDLNLHGTDWEFADEKPAPHGGEHHAISDKRALAHHIGEPHLQGNRSRKVAFPDVTVRSRWRKDELEREHRILHGEEV